MLDYSQYSQVKVQDVMGRYVTNSHIIDFLKQLDASFGLETIGSSENGLPIYGLTVGSGKKKIFMWSQMHGNESTTTKAVLDLLNFFQMGSEEAKTILKEFTIKIIPILNPDGAQAYTRFNANGVDLNRDAQKRTQKESLVLRKTFNDFRPNFCFNLHDQRTIFNVGNDDKPATVAFLAPAFDYDRNNSPTRKKSMQIIAAMNKTLQNIIPGQVARFDDSFNPNCIGDAFQMKKTPTILFEAGHYQEDYERERTREFIYYALRTAIKTIQEDSLSEYSVEDYMAISENKKLFFDIVLLNASEIDKTLNKNECIGVLYKEVLKDNKIAFEPKIEKKGFKPNSFFGHKMVDCLVSEDLKWLESNKIIDLVSPKIP
ncbi:peptidase M14 [Maribacter sp. MMG018]|uniref:M14 family metallopeptidase n=1 Tax=Maribacter sp. MMG018 TaxID=2822688 RepID=UPI001B379A02|nr:M14 metallopeptidase family protein [Maribacter sp. MMG018]MBQ4915207.1 peptidase M14 [Maribacter sp. MMG018]